MHTLPLTVGCLVGTVLAQGGQATTRRIYGNYAIEGLEVGVGSLPKSTVLPAGFTTVMATTANTSAETVLGWHPGPGASVAVSVSEQATGWAVNGPMEFGTMAAPAGPRNLGPHVLRLGVVGTPLTRGKLELWAMGFVGPGARTSIDVDIGDDGVADFTYVAGTSVVFQRQQWDVHLDPQGELQVCIRTQGHAVAGVGLLTTYFTGITVRFTPGSFCEVTPYGSRCGANLIAYDTVDASGHALRLELADAPPTAPGLLLVGSRPLNLPIPRSPCLLYADAAVTLGFASDALGNAAQDLPLPRIAATLDLRLQALLLSGTLLSASNGVAVTCRP